MNKNNLSLDSQFLIRVLKNEVTQEELELFNQWLESSDENKEEFGQIALLWEKTANLPAPLSPELESEWYKFQRKLFSVHDLKMREALDKTKFSFSNGIFNTYDSKRKVFFSNYFRKYVVITRAAALILITLVVYWVFRIPSSPTKVIQDSSPKFYEYVTRKGEKAIVPLSDGSVVYLNADSKLIYPQYFDDNKRLLKLEGEGYFSVKANPNKPFIVQTGDRFTIVKGTEFNIKFRNKKLSVVVTKGKVVVYNQDSSKYVNIKKGELSFATENGFTQPKKVDTRLYVAWRENKLSFIATPFSEVLEEIERFFNIQTICKNKRILSKRLTGYFDSNSIDEILTKISLALDCKYQRNGNKIIIF